MTHRLRERYVTMNLPGNDGEGDESAHGNPTMAEAPWHGYDSAWQVFAHMAEAAVGRVFNFGGSDMQLVRDEKRRTIGVQKLTYWKSALGTYGSRLFGYDQIDQTVDLGDYREAGVATWDTKLGQTLQKR